MSTRVRRGVGAKVTAGSILQFLRTSRKKTILIFAAPAFLCILVGLYWLIWPFSKRAVVKDLSQASDSTISVYRFHSTFFPIPGCVLEGVLFRRGPNRLIFISVQKLEIQGSYLGILRRHVPRVTAIGAHVIFPPSGSGTAFHTHRSKNVIDDLVANGTLVEFKSAQAGKKPLLFDVHDALLKNVQQKAPIEYRLRFHNPDPPGEVVVAGKFGPWPARHPEQIPLSGEYTLNHADLGAWASIAGILASKGKFGGVLQHVRVEGTAETSDFEVKSNGHPIPLSTQFRAQVDALHGDTFLEQAEARLGSTMLQASGSIARAAGKKGKLTNLQFVSQQGRIEDLLRLFAKAPRPAMSGPISLRAQVEIPPGRKPFLRRVKLDGVFGISQGSFKPRTQTEVNKLSAGARRASKEDPPTVLSDLSGQVALADGVARFSWLSFRTPGARARMLGSFNVVNDRVDLHGRLTVDSTVSQTTTGMKAWLLKILDPFFTKKKKGEVVPVHIGGTYGHPQFGLDLKNPKIHKASRKQVTQPR